MQDYKQLTTAVPNAESVGLCDIVETLFRRRKLFVALVVLLGLGMAAYVVSRPTVYPAEMTFLVKNDRADVVVSPGQTSNVAARQWVDEIQVNTEVQLLSSRELMRDVAQKCWFPSPSANPGARTASDAELDRAAQDLERSVSVTPMLKANMIRVSYASANPQETVTVLRTLADSYLDRHLKVHSTAGSYEFFHLQALYYGQRLKQAQDELARFQGPRNIVLLGQQKDLVLRKVVDLQASKSEAEALGEETGKRIVDLKLQIARLSPRVVAQTRQVPHLYAVEHLSLMVTELENKRSELLGKFQPTDRLVRQIEEQIAHTRAALAGERTGTTTEEASELNPLRQSLEAELSKAQTTVSGLEGRVRTVTQQIREYQRQLSEMDRATGADDQLLRSIKECEENYFLYSRKGEEARIAEALDRQKIGNVELIDAPRLPSAAQPKFNRSTAAAGALGLLIIVCVVFAASVLRNTVSTAAELEALLGLPVLATVPFQKGLAIKPWAGGVHS